VSVPSFAATGEAVLVDLATLDCAPLRFKSLQTQAAAAATGSGAMEDS
jgi:hypothetical protein